MRIGKLCVDATSERFFATLLKSKMRSLGIPTELVISSESKVFRSEKMNYECYSGNLTSGVLGLLLNPNNQIVANRGVVS